jgi:purine-binding chemotaxis protein CheW
MKKETRSILKSRALIMAIEPDYISVTSDTIDIIEFTLGNERYGIESAYVREVYQLKDFTSLPGLPLFIFGIINVRGQILAVIDLRKFLNIPEKGIGELNKVIILRNNRMEFGVLADLVEGTRTLDLDELMSAPIEESVIASKYLKGITIENTIVLDAGIFLNDEKMVINEDVI